jgi:ribosome-associated heat shock protein Hsp15
MEYTGAFRKTGQILNRPEWRNWQTRCVQGAVGFTPVGVRIPPPAPRMEVRLDKWLQVARVFKTRSQATHACSLGRVEVNGMPAKPHRLLSLEDRIEVSYPDWKRVLIVKQLRDKSVAKALARELYEDLSPPRPKLDLIDRIMRQGTERREKGKGRPTKRERRETDRLKRKQ